MKALGGFLILTMAMLAGLVFAGSSGTAQAETCANTSSCGSITLDVPGLSSDSERWLWVRMQTTNPNDQILAEVSGVGCLEIGGHEATAHEWSWQTHRRNQSVVPIKFASGDGNSIRIIGISDGARVDRVL